MDPKRHLSFLGTKSVCCKIQHEWRFDFETWALCIVACEMWHKSLNSHMPASSAFLHTSKPKLDGLLASWTLWLREAHLPCGMLIAKMRILFDCHAMVRLPAKWPKKDCFSPPIQIRVNRANTRCCSQICVHHSFVYCCVFFSFLFLFIIFIFADRPK